MASKSPQSSYRSPPLMRDDLSYVEWKKELEIWSDFTDLDKGRQGGALFLTLSGKARQAVLSGVSREKIKSENGIQGITECLDELYLKDKSQSGFAAYEDFTNYRRPQNVSIQDYLVEFNLKYNKIKTFEMSLPQGVLAFYLLKCANLPEEQSNICRATCASLTYRDMHAQIERVSSTLGKAETSGPIDQGIPVHSQFYGSDYPEEEFDYNHYWEYEACEEPEEEAPREALYNHPSHSQPRRRFQPPGPSANPRQNPLDEFGRTSRCSYCQSTYHWVANCPHAPPSSRGSGRGTRSFRPGYGRARPSRGGRGGPSYRI